MKFGNAEMRSKSKDSGYLVKMQRKWLKVENRRKIRQDSKNLDISHLNPEIKKLATQRKEFMNKV